MYKYDIFETKRIIDKFDSLKLSLKEKKNQEVFFKEQELDISTIPKNFSQIPMNKIENSLNLLSYDPENNNFFKSTKNEYVIQLSGEKLFYLPNEWDYKSLDNKTLGYVCLKDSYIPLKIRKFDGVWKYVEY